MVSITRAEKEGPSGKERNLSLIQFARRNGEENKMSVFIFLSRDWFVTQPTDAIVSPSLCSPRGVFKRIKYAQDSKLKLLRLKIDWIFEFYCFQFEIMQSRVATQTSSADDWRMCSISAMASPGKQIDFSARTKPIKSRILMVFMYDYWLLFAFTNKCFQSVLRYTNKQIYGGVVNVQFEGYTKTETIFIRSIKQFCFSQDWSLFLLSLQKVLLLCGANCFMDFGISAWSRKSLTIKTQTV